MSGSPPEWTAWLGVIGAATTIVALFNDRFAVALASVAAVALILSANFVREARRKVRGAGLSIEEMAVDSLRLAEIGRTYSGDVVVHRAVHHASIRGADLEQWIEIEGIAQKRVGEVTFSLDSDSRTALENLACYGYDLIVDPAKRSPIAPMTKSLDGLSKKVVVPLAESVNRNGPIHAAVHSRTRGCMGPGKDYFFSSLAFDQLPPIDWTIELEFVDAPPAYVRQYDVTDGGQPHLRCSVVGTISPNGTKYTVRDKASPARAVRVFVFDRSERN